MKRSLIFLFAFVFISTGNVILAQNKANNDLDALKDAYLNIKQGRYNEAYPYFKKMLDLYPKEPTYNYYVGICLLNIDKNPVNALKYLRFAATKDVPDDIYFYLGQAYLKNYEFDKALDTFKWFEKKASKQQQKEFDLKNYISKCENGLFLIKYVRKPQVFSKTDYNKNDFYKKYEIPDLEGKFVDRDEFFKRKKDSVNKSSVLFVPNFLERNEVLYFADVNKKRGDLDIFRVVRINDTTWSEPENLGDKINTPFDENYPFLHSDGTTLYFASKGQYSMGGYDIYKSSWNWEKQEWSEPENLDFPLNSPYDDILYVPSPNKKIAYFSTNRQTDKNNYQVIGIRVDNSVPYIEPNSHDEILKLAELKVDVLPEKKEKKTEKEDRYKPTNVDFVKIKNEQSIVHRSEYDSLLNQAISYQLKADSLRWAIDDKRAVFDETENAQERARIGNLIIELEREIYILQKKADTCYERVREIEQTNLVSQKAIYDTPKTQKKDDEEIIRPDESKTQKLFVEPVDNSIKKSKLEDEVVEEPVTTNENFGLTIKWPSIYNTKNPIPMNEKLPVGVIYMIQLGAFSSPKTPDVFNGLTPLTCIKPENSNVRKYFAGRFYHLAEAEKSLSIVKSKGFKDAYIVAFNSGKIIAVSNAVKLESDKIANVLPIEKKDNKKEINKDSLAIIYVLKSDVLLRDSAIVEQIIKIIPNNKSVFQEKDSTKLNLIIKSFKSFDEAYPVKKSIESILNKEVEIHAYFAESQIPIEQARKMTQ